MKSLVGEVKKSESVQIGVIKQEYQKGYDIPALPYQKYGILTRVLWPGKSQILRIIPGYDENTGEVFRQLKNCDRFSFEAPRQDYLSDTFIESCIIEKFGDVGPIISSYPEGSQDALMYGGETVLRHFVRRILYSCGEKGARRGIIPTNEMKMWAAYGGGGSLSYDKPALLMQTLAFHINGRNNKGEDKNDLVDENGNIRPLLTLSIITDNNSMQALYDALVLPANRSLPPDASSNNQFGPLAELDGILLYLNPKTDSKGHSVMEPSVQPSGSTGWNATPFPLSADFVRSLWVPWDKLLQPMTAQEQLRLCASQFGADTVNYVIGTDRTLNIEIPEDIKAAGLGRYVNLAGSSVALSSGIPNVVPAASANPAPTMPSFNPAGLGTVPGVAVPQKQQPKVAAAAPAGGIRPGKLSPPRLGAVQNTGTIDPQKVLQNVAAIRAATGMQAPAASASSQADAAGALIGGLPSDEDN